MLDSIHSNHGIHGISSLIGRELSRPRWRLDWHAKEELFQQVWVELLSRWPDQRWFPGDSTRPRSSSMTPSWSRLRRATNLFSIC